MYIIVADACMTLPNLAILTKPNELLPNVKLIATTVF